MENKTKILIGLGVLSAAAIAYFTFRPKPSYNYKLL